MAEKTLQELRDQANTNLPDNTTGEISPFDVRNQHLDETDSFESIQAVAWGEWQSTTPQVIDGIGQKLLIENLYIEDRPKDFVRPLWNATTSALDLQFANCLCQLDFEFTATASQNNTTLILEIQDAVTQEVLRTGEETLPRQTESTFTVSIPFALDDSIPAQTIVTNGIIFYALSTGTVTITDKYFNINMRRKRSTL